MSRAAFTIQTDTAATDTITETVKHFHDVALDFLSVVGYMGRWYVLVLVWETKPFLPRVSETPWTSRVGPEEAGQSHKAR